MTRQLGIADGDEEGVVVGALGVIGRYIVERLLAAGLDVVGLSRRDAPAGPRYRHWCRSARCADVGRKLGSLSDATHVFYAAVQPGTGRAADYATVVAPNRDMLVNAVSAIAKGNRALQRVVLVTGTKYYGVHLGPLKTPMRETDPRHMPPDFYFDQIDWLTGFQRGRKWSFTELRPQTLCGFARSFCSYDTPAFASATELLLRELESDATFSGPATGK
jgi:nucleoside-diphosphate-sugar epimerase